MIFCEEVCLDVRLQVWRNWKKLMERDREEEYKESLLVKKKECKMDEEMMCVIAEAR